MPFHKGNADTSQEVCKINPLRLLKSTDMVDR